ncbi:DUF6787 family protein [Capnocytophaga canimorsus]|uniref:DUF6787 family protein n=1 Tax=Capnocytophaga canimorsus TaxID=28188 RepID=UPI0037D5C7D3
MFEKLKKRWNVTSNRQVVIILLVFAITGSVSAKLGKPFCDYLNIYPHTFHPVLYWIIRLIIILPIYQVILLIVGAVFGQFRFFWEFEKRMFRIGQKTKKTVKRQP